MTEFVPPKTRGRWLSMMAFIVVAGFPATSLLGYLIIPTFGWRPMFVIAGIGSLVVWYLRKNLPESPRWLEAQGRTDEAEALMQAIEQEASGGKPLPPVVVPAPVPLASAFDLAKPPLLQRMVVGSWVLISINTLIFGFVLFLPQFFLRQGLTITNSLAYTVVLSAASLVGCAVGAYTSDTIGRRASIIGASIVTIIRLHLCPLQPSLRSGDHFDRRLRPDRVHLCADRAAVRRLSAGTVSDRNQTSRQRNLQHVRTRRHCDLTLHRWRADRVVGFARRHLADDRCRCHPDRGGVGLGRRAAQPRPGGRRRKGVIAFPPPCGHADGTGTGHVIST
jgi:Major Facilitator Superfamily